MIVDANVFLEVILNQEHAAECDRLLQSIETGAASAIVTDFTLHGIAVTMERRGRKSELPAVFDSISRFKGLTVVHATVTEHGLIASLGISSGLDFDDAYQAYFARKLGVPVVSYDHDFDGVVERKTPAQLL